MCRQYYFGARCLSFLIYKMSFRMFLSVDILKRLYKIIPRKTLFKNKNYIQNLLITFIILLSSLCLKIFLLKVLTPK